MTAVVAEMHTAHAAHLKPSDLNAPALAGSDTDTLPNTALAAASLQSSGSQASTSGTSPADLQK